VIKIEYVENENEEKFTFIMDADRAFGNKELFNGRYSNTKIFDAGWVFTVSYDEDISSFITHLAFSNMNTKQLIDEFNTNPDLFAIFKEDIVNSNLPRMIGLILIRNGYWHLADILYRELNKFSQEEVDRLIASFGKFGDGIIEMEEKIIDDSIKDLILGIKASGDMPELLKFIRNGGLKVIVDNTEKIVNYYMERSKDNITKTEVDYVI